MKKPNFENLTRENFDRFVEDASFCLLGAAQRLVIFESLNSVSQEKTFHHAIISACLRDAVTMLYSVCEDKWRYGGIVGVSGHVIKKVEAEFDSWIREQFCGVHAELKSLMRARPQQIITRIKLVRDDATAHFPQSRHNNQEHRPLSYEEAWEVLSWAAEIMGTLVPVLRPGFGFKLDREDLVRKAADVFSKPLLIETLDAS